MSRAARLCIVTSAFAIAGVVLFVLMAPHAQSAFNVPDAVPGQVNFIGIDTDTTGNTFISISSVQTTRYVTTGQLFDIDIVIDEVHPTDGLQGFSAHLHYDPAHFRVTSSDFHSMLDVLPSSNIQYIDSAKPNFDGDYRAERIDLDATQFESGEGVLERITMKCDSAGVTSLYLDDPDGETPNAVIYDQNSNPIQANSSNTATIACDAFTPTPTPAPICTPIPGDTDCDGYIDANDNCPTVRNENQTDLDGDNVGNACDNCPDWPNSSQALPAWPVPSMDTDCDGFPDNLLTGGLAPETSIGTQATAHCAASPVANDEGLPDAWPVDFNDDQLAGGQDVLKLAQAFNSHAPGPPYSVRMDFNGDGVVGGQDVLKLAPFFNKRCA